MSRFALAHDDIAAELGWDQALTWRMQRQSLIKRVPHDHWMTVISTLGGVHAQVMSSAVAAAAVRVDGLSVEDVARALWTERSLVKLWAMRGTLHLLPAIDHPIWTAALRSTYPTAYGHYRMADPELLEVATMIGEVLRDRLLSRSQLAAELQRTRRLPAALVNLLTSSWGNGLKPASFLGVLCYGPPLNGEPQFTNPHTWLTATRTVDDVESLRAVGRRYFAGYGPATVRDLAAWWGAPQRSVLPIMESIRSELAVVKIADQQYYVLQRDLDTLLGTEPARADDPVVRLLPSFDPWVVGGNRTSKPGIGNPTLDPDRRSAVYRLQGWVSAVIIVNGMIAGTWTRSRHGQEIELQPFRRITGPARVALNDEVNRHRESQRRPS